MARSPSLRRSRRSTARSPRHRAATSQARRQRRLGAGLSHMARGLPTGHRPCTPSSTPTSIPELANRADSRGNVQTALAILYKSDLMMRALANSQMKVPILAEEVQSRPIRPIKTNQKTRQMIARTLPYLTFCPPMKTWIEHLGHNLQEKEGNSPQFDGLPNKFKA